MGGPKCEDPAGELLSGELDRANPLPPPEQPAKSDEPTVPAFDNPAARLAAQESDPSSFAATAGVRVMPRPVTATSRSAQS